MKAIIGLGNPGRRYAATRHNVGFMVIRDLAARHGVRMARWVLDGRRLVARYGDWVFRETQVRLMLPQTMMNRSGEALVAMSSWWEEALVVCDEVNLPLGMLRLKPSGSAGGHKGLASCLMSLGTDRIPRLRIGIGIQPLPKDLTDFVLSPFRAAERALIRETITRAVEVCELWATHGIQIAMNRANPVPMLR